MYVAFSLGVAFFLGVAFVLVMSTTADFSS